ncbi:MAG: uracil-DNA glycosylase [Campylobacter sp.]|nr:uracil-DNA glycosylase [Campylobacter sp.]
MDVNLENFLLDESWQNELKNVFLNPKFDTISSNLAYSAKNSEIYPPKELIFNAFNLTPFEKVKVVVLGQDPYHKKELAMGLSFSVPKGVKIPPSLQNIYKELFNDLAINPPNHGDLTYWAKQGVLLLNATLSVEAGKANSHKNIGWKWFSDSVIKILNDKKEGLVFLLWGNFAKAKADLIDENRHFILTAPHPSPLARGGFFGCKHFSKTNEILGKNKIDWDINNY